GMISRRPRPSWWRVGLSPRPTRWRQTWRSSAWPSPSGARPNGTTGCCCQPAPWPLPLCRRRCRRSSGSCWSAGCCFGLPGGGGGSQDRNRRLLDDAVDQPVLDRLLRVEEEVSVGVALDSLQCLTGVLGDQLVEDAPDADDLTRVDVEVAGLPLQTLTPDQWLMHVDGCARQRESASLRAGHEDHRAEAGGSPDADRRDRQIDEQTGCVDPQTR